MYLAIMCHYHNEQYLHINSIEGWAYQTIILIGYNESNQYVIFITISYYLVHLIVTRYVASIFILMISYNKPSDAIFLDQILFCIVVNVQFCEYYDYL